MNNSSTKPVIALLWAAIILTFLIILTGCGGIGDGPDVRGYNLPDAKTTIENAGYSSSVTSDGLLGVLVEENWTVCEQKAPQGKMIALEVSKNC